MFINDQWLFSELSDEYVDWMEEQESKLNIVIDQDALVYF